MRRILLGSLFAKTSYPVVISLIHTDDSNDYREMFGDGCID